MLASAPTKEDLLRVRREKALAYVDEICNGYDINLKLRRVVQHAHEDGFFDGMEYAFSLIKR